MKLIYSLFLSLFIVASLNAQSLWEITPGTQEYANVGGDTSLTHLKELVKNGTKIQKQSALLWLGHNYSNTEKEFITNYLMYPKNNSFSYWNDYYLFYLIKGALGDEDSVEGLKKLIESDADWELKVSSILKLVEADDYTSYKEVINAYKEGKDEFLLLLNLYKELPEYQTEIIEVLENTVKDSSEVIATDAAIILADLDRFAAITLLEQRLYESSEPDRFYIFNGLGSINPTGQPGRVKNIIQKEKDEYIITNYLPVFSSNENELIRNFVEPDFIQFLKSFYDNIDSEIVKGHIKMLFLDDYEPIDPSESVSNEILFDSLIVLNDKLGAEPYNWIGNKGFVRELNNRLNNAKNHFDRKNYKNSIKQIENYILRIEGVYDDTKESGKNNQFLTKDGYKFLYHNAIYLLERLKKKL